MFRSLVLRGVSTVSRLNGVAIQPKPREHLINIYEKTLKEIETLPDISFYKNATKAITLERLDLVKNNEVEAIISKSNCFQIEQLILEAKDELYLLSNLKASKPWEPLLESAPEGQWEK